MLAAAFPGLITLRRRLISAPLLRWLRHRLPPLSATERDALEAGDVWWEGELLSGRPDWQKLMNFSAAELTAEEEAFLNGPVNQLCRLLDDWHIIHERRDLPPEVWDFIRQQGFFGLEIPRRYGGMSFSSRAHSEVVIRIASRSLTAAVTVMVPNSLGPGELILKYGTDEQKNHYLPRLARGEEIPCFALTAPEAGSDAGAMTDNGVVCEQDGVLGIRLNWNKRYITLAPVATLLGLAFKLYDPDHLLGDQENLGITLALIPTDTPGVEVGERHDPMGIPFQNGPTRGRDVFIPIDQVIGGREGLGRGWRMLMECLAEGRGISLPALSTSAAQLAARTTGAYARIRRQFRIPIGSFEGIEQPLARIGGLAYLIDAARRLTLSALNQGIHPVVGSAILKYHTTESMRQVIIDSMDIHGGKTIMQGPRNYLNACYQAIPISITVEGANILTRCMIIYGQGAVRCHPFLLEEMHAAESGNLERFDRALFGHLGFFLGNVSRALLLGLTHGRLARVPKTADHRTLQHLSRFSALLACLSDISLGLLGGELKRRERISARHGDVLSHLYLTSALLHHFDGSEAERPLQQWGMAWCLHRMEQAVIDLLDNYPPAWLGRLLKRLLLPWGACFPPPSDRLDRVVAQLLQQPSPLRDRLTASIFLPEADDEPVTLLERALNSVIAAETIERRLHQAVKTGRIASVEDIDAALAAGLMSSKEAEQLREAQRLTQEVIAVDAFPANEFAYGFKQEERS